MTAIQNVTFIRKPVTMKDVREGTSWIVENFGAGRDRCYVAAEKHLTAAEWKKFTGDLLDDRSWIQEYAEKDLPMIEGASPCLRVTGDGSEIALLVDPSGYGYARYVAIEQPATMGR